MKKSLQQIEDDYINLGYKNEKLRKALENDSEYQNLLRERKQELTKTFKITQVEAKKYALSTDTDFEILAKCKQLEKLNLSDDDRKQVRLIKTQLEDDWRGSLLELLKSLLRKYSMNYKGVIIVESLKSAVVLKKVKILKSKVEKVTPKHKTPWFKQWTLQTVEISEQKADEIAQEISKSLDYSHGSAWYADFKNDQYHYIIYKNKIFKIDRSKPEEYQAATDYGISLGIPEYQVDFAPSVKAWQR